MMPRPLELLNPELSGSSVSLDRGSNASFDGIENPAIVDGTSENAYNKLQRNDYDKVKPPSERGQNDIYDVVGPKARSQFNSKTSQTSNKPSRVKRRRWERAIRVVLVFLIVFVAIVAMLLSILLMLGKIGPKCSCRRSGSSPIVGKVAQLKNTSDLNVQSTFNMDLSPFYDALKDLKTNVTSLRRQAEFVMVESEGNKDALVATWTELSSIENAITAFSNRFDSAIDQVNSTVQEFDPDDGLVIEHIRTLNSTLVNELAGIKQTSDQQNNAIDSSVHSLNNTIAEEVAVKISDSGPVGDRGPKGLKGTLGDVGVTGLPGPSGNKGPKGLRGDSGLQGNKGFPGTDGMNGLPGEKGFKGAMGEGGATGAPGIHGDSGPNGIGNFSWCTKKSNTAKALDIRNGADEAAVSDTQSFKVISATCSTDVGNEYNLHVTTVSSNPKLHKFSCVCDGVSPSTVNCILYYFECPINPP